MFNILDYWFSTKGTQRVSVSHTGKIKEFTVDPWTTQRLGVPIFLTVENLNIIFSQLFGPAVLHSHIQPTADPIVLRHLPLKKSIYKWTWGAQTNGQLFFKNKVRPHPLQLLQIKTLLNHKLGEHTASSQFSASY